MFLRDIQAKSGMVGNYGIGKSSKGINKTTKKLIYKVECRNRVIKRHKLVGVAC